MSEEAGITVTLPKPMTSNSTAEGRFGKQDFVYLPEEDVYRCPASERLTFHYVNEENVHAKVLYGRSSHHHVEAVFKAFARALRVACAKDARLAKMLPSTKGLL